MKHLENLMSMLRNTSAIALMIAMGVTTAHAQTKPAAKDVVIVHGALADGSGWRAIYDILNKDGFHVTIVQEPLTGLAEDVDATKRVIDQQTGPVVLVGHSYGGSVITEAGNDPKVSALVYVAALQPDKGEASGQLMSKFAAPNDAMRAATNRTSSISTSRRRSSMKPMPRTSRRRRLSSCRTRSSNLPRRPWARLSPRLHGTPSPALPS
jgi:pimeloyl-ACP methyl ester carboxylesterase